MYMIKMYKYSTRSRTVVFSLHVDAMNMCLSRPTTGFTVPTVLEEKPATRYLRVEI